MSLTEFVEDFITEATFRTLLFCPLDQRQHDAVLAFIQAYVR